MRHLIRTISPRFARPSRKATQCRFPSKFTCSKIFEVDLRERESTFLELGGAATETTFPEDRRQTEKLKAQVSELVLSDVNPLAGASSLYLRRLRHCEIRYGFEGRE